MSQGNYIQRRLRQRRAELTDAMLDSIKAQGLAANDDEARAFIRARLDKLIRHKARFDFDTLVDPDFWPLLIAGVFEDTPNKQRRQ